MSPPGVEEAPEEADLREGTSGGLFFWVRWAGGALCFNEDFLWGGRGGANDDEEELGFEEEGGFGGVAFGLLDGGGLAGRFGAGLDGRGGGDFFAVFAAGFEAELGLEGGEGLPGGGPLPPDFFLSCFRLISSIIGLPVGVKPGGSLEEPPPEEPPPREPPFWAILLGESGRFMVFGSTFFNFRPFLIADIRSSLPEAFECFFKSLIDGAPDGGGGGGGGILAN